MALVSKTFSEIITFTRASTGSYFDSAGTLQSAGINTPRLDYNPSTLAAQGLLIEEQRANLVLQSAALSTQNVTVTAVAHTLSFYGTGTIVLSGATTNTLIGTGAFPTRSTLTFTPTAGTLTLTVTGTVQYGQLEIGSFATSYIPTTTTSLTRSADVASVNTLSPWYNASAGTLYAEATPISPTTNALNQIVVSIDDTTTNNRLQLSRTTSVGGYSFLVAVGGVTGWNPQVGVWANQTAGKLAAAFATSDQKFAYVGLLDSGAGTGAIPSSLTHMQIGARADGALQFNGYIRRITYYPRRLTDAELQTITA